MESREENRNRCDARKSVLFKSYPQNNAPQCYNLSVVIASIPNHIKLL